MPLPSTAPIYSADERKTLIYVARKSIAHGVRAQEPLPLEPSDYPDPLGAVRCSFVTLRIAGKLRGCMGSLTPQRPLVQDVAYNAYSSSARDPRFSAVTEPEVNELQIHLSVLSEAVPLEFESRDELFALIRPGIDGLILRSSGRSGTLLPAVWQSLPEVQPFWDQLLKKAGLPEGYWDDDLAVLRYTTESFGESR